MGDTKGPTTHLLSHYGSHYVAEHIVGQTFLVGHLRNPGTETFPRKHHRQQQKNHQETTIWDGWQEIALFSDTGVI